MKHFCQGYTKNGSKCGHKTAQRFCYQHKSQQFGGGHNPRQLTKLSGVNDLYFF